MAIIITTSPSTKSSAYLPIIFECTSDRNNSTSLVITSVANDGSGKAKFTVASNSVFKTNNTVTISGCTETTYNGTFDITADTATTFTINTITFVATDTGTAIITNTNFKIKGTLFVFDQTKYNITAVADLGSGLLQFTTSVAHGFIGGSYLLIRGTTDYNGEKVFVLSSTSTTFVIVGTFTSSQTGTVQKGTQTGIKYMNAISVNGSDIFRFTFSGMLQSVLSSNLDTTYPAAVINDVPNCIKAFVVLFTEVYDIADGTSAEHSTILSTFKYALNITLQHQEAQTLTAFTLGSSSRKFLTDSPSIQKIRAGEETQLSFIGVAATTYKIAYQKYDLAGTAAAVAYSSNFTLVDDYGIVSVNGNNYLSSIISKVDIWIVNTSNTQMSEKKTFVIETKCAPYYNRFYFFNKRGGYDAFTFTGPTKIKRNRNKTSFTKTRPVDFLITDRGQTSLSTSINQVFETLSRMLTNDESIWLQQLLDSNMVFIQETEASASYIPVVLLDGEQNEYVSKDDLPNILKATYIKANAIISQVN